jgi:hypothetical protein
MPLFILLASVDSLKLIYFIMFLSFFYRWWSKLLENPFFVISFVNVSSCCLSVFTCSHIYTYRHINLSSLFHTKNNWFEAFTWRKQLRDRELECERTSRQTPLNAWLNLKKKIILVFLSHLYLAADCSEIEIFRLI